MLDALSLTAIEEAIRMSLTLYAHPFAAYCWKALIALYENETPFTYRVVEDAAGWAELEPQGAPDRD